MNQKYFHLKEQLRQYGLCPEEWNWKDIQPEIQKGRFENKFQQGVFLGGEWKKDSGLKKDEKPETWSYLEIQI